MASPSRMLAAVATLAIAVLLAVLAATWGSRGGGSGATAPPPPQTPTSAQALELRSPPAPDGGAHDGAREIAATSTDSAGADVEAPIGAHVVVFVHDVDRQPVPGALVEITGGGPLGSYTADGKGVCPLPVEPGSGFLTLHVSAVGFVPSCGRFAAERIPIRLYHATDVTGRVVEAESHAPVADASVSVPQTQCADEVRRVITDLAGRFELARLPRGSVMTWRVEAAGFTTLAREMRLSDPDVELALERGVPLVLEVVDAQTDAPIEGATIAGETAKVVTDASGRLETSALVSATAEQARLSVSAPGYCMLSAPLRVSELAPGDTLRLPLLAGVRLEGSVLGTDGTPVQGAQVLLRFDAVKRMRSPDASPHPEVPLELPGGWTYRGPPFQQDTTDTSGRFVLDGLEPGSSWYEVRAVAPSGTVSTAQPVPPLGLPGSSTHVEIVLRALDSGRISGTLTLNGVPTGGGVAWRGPNRAGSATVGSSGSFRLENVEAGHVELSPWPTGIRRGPGNPGPFSGQWTVDVEPDAEVHIDIALELELAPIAGRVVDAEGAPLQGVGVWAGSDEGSWSDTDETATDGSFELSVRAGPWPYVVVAGEVPRQVAREGVNAGTRDLELVLVENSELRLRVVDAATREPLTGFVASLVDSRGERMMLSELINSEFTPDTQGWHECTPRQGTYRLFVGDFPGGSASGYLPVDGGEVRIVAGAPPVSVELERDRGAEVSVQLAQGTEPWPDDVRVLLLEADRCDQVELGDRGWQIGQAYRGLNVLDARTLKLDSHGRARARALWPGKCRFVAFPATIAIEPAEITVSGDEIRPVELRWTPR